MRTHANKHNFAAPEERVATRSQRRGCDDNVV
jgi:hypothetical protein